MAVGSPCVSGGVVERVEGGVEPLLAAPVGFMVGFGRYEPDQLVEVVVAGGEDRVVVVSVDPEDESFAVWVEQPRIARCGRDVVRDDDLVGGLGDGELPAAQIERRVLSAADPRS